MLCYRWFSSAERGKNTHTPLIHNYFLQQQSIWKNLFKVVFLFIIHVTGTYEILVVRSASLHDLFFLLNWTLKGHTVKVSGVCG